MGLGASDLANWVGTHLVPFTNPRVVSPPGRVLAGGRLNLMVATPMRSGTHILIDLILNNLPAYRRRPLYVDLDQCMKQTGPEHDWLADLTPESGQVLKTHMPLGVPDGMMEDSRISALTTAACVVTVQRPRAEVCRSLGRWHGVEPDTAEAEYGAQYDQFWARWEGQGDVMLTFENLFDPVRMQAVLQEVAERTGTWTAARYMAPPSGASRNRIYANKMLTRLLGHRAPRIDTTIHTLK